MPPVCEKCSLYASFDFIGSTVPKFCFAHKSINMVDVSHTKCEVIKCRKHASCGYEEDGIRIRCGGHKFNDMIYLSLKYCTHIDGCNTLASFGYKGEDHPERCNTHKLDGMISLLGKRCEGILENGDSCIIRATYGIKGTRSVVFCKLHTPAEGYENVAETRHCLECDKRPSFAFSKTDKPTYCEDHCLNGMENIYSKKCMTTKETCNKNPTFGISSPTHCRKHKESDMNDMRHVWCIVENCYKKGSDSKERKRASFNYRGEKIRLYCDEHKKPGMINLERPLCKKTGCPNQMHWGYMFQKRKFCKEHKDSNMYDEDHINPKCVDCPKPKSNTKSSMLSIRAIFCKNGESYPTKCEKHVPKDGTYVNISEKTCELCKLVDQIPSNRTLCSTCYPHSKQRILHKKEIRVKTVLDANKILVMSYDKIPEGACSKYRPDFVIDCGNSLIILEVDENQHFSYACECEVSRMIQLHNDFGGIPLIFIRYNPDDYKNLNGDKIKGKPKNLDRESKLIDLISRIQMQINDETYPTHPLSVYYLYYNGYNDEINRNIIDYYSNSVTEIVEKIF